MSLVLSLSAMRRLKEQMAAEAAARRAEVLRKRRETAEAGEIAIDACILRDPRVRGLTPRETAAQRLCYLDGEPLPAKRSRWCSEACAERFWRNHGWTTARSFALFRARISLVVAIARTDLVELVVEALPGRAWDYLKPRCERCWIATHSIEINHVVPRNGLGYGNGCWNHQTNLEPLCHACHVVETKAQGRERRGQPLEGPPIRVKPQPGIPIWDWASR